MRWLWLAAPTYCYWRYCVTCCAWVGVLGGEIKRQRIYVSPLPAFLEPAIARLPKALASLRAPLSPLTRASCSPAFGFFGFWQNFCFPTNSRPRTKMDFYLTACWICTDCAMNSKKHAADPPKEQTEKPRHHASKVLRPQLGQGHKKGIHKGASSRRILLRHLSRSPRVQRPRSRNR